MDQQEVLGRLCRDKVTLIEGICTGTIDWMFGCRQFIAKPRYENKEKSLEYIDKSFDIPEACLEILDSVPAIDAGFPPEEKPKYFGKICRDKVTGYEGMCIGRIWTFYSEKQYCLQAKYSKKKLRKPLSMWVDEGRIEVLESKDGVTPEDMQTERKGGVMDISLPRL